MPLFHFFTLSLFPFSLYLQIDKMRRRKTAIFFLVLGISLSALAIALNVGWILLNLREVALLVLGIIFFALIITGLILNTVFLVREIRRSEQHDVRCAARRVGEELPGVARGRPQPHRDHSFRFLRHCHGCAQPGVRARAEHCHHGRAVSE